jgi:nucleoside-diphosphate-sugar epimerase
VISIFTSRLHQGKAPVIYGDGEQTRDFVYVEDLVRALLLACEREAAVGEVLNVASGTQTSILQLVATLNQVLGTDLSPRFEPARPGEVRYSEGNARRARNVLGWEATIPIHEGLSRMIRMEE